MSTTSGPTHRSVSNIRPSPSPNPAGPGSPHTPPSRVVSGNYGSPSGLRPEDDTVIIELGARYLRAGQAGESIPQAVISYGPEEQRRAGDYRRWDSAYDKGWRSRQVGCKEWGERHELWKLDLRDLDMGLVGDKIARAVRDAYTKFLLIDSRPRRIVLVLPSVLPLPLLSIVLDTLFENFQAPTISLLSSPALTTFAAGLRAALVVDIGWAETIVTGIYEYREIQSYRSIRASKWLGQEMLKMLATALQDPKPKPESGNEPEDDEYQDLISFEECEEVTTRMAWCKPIQPPPKTQLSTAMNSLQLNPSTSPETPISIPLKSTQPPTTLYLPFSQLSEPCENAFFATGVSPKESDDNELPLPSLLYHTLLRLPLDVRSLCMSRIIFVGGASTIPGLRQRILDELQRIIDERSWDPVTGRAAEAVKARKKLLEERRPSIARNKQANSGPSEVSVAAAIPTILSGEEETTMLQSAADIPQERDTISNHLQRSVLPTPVQGILRAVDSLGAWTGASLITTLKIPPVSIVERDTWAMQGMGGAKRVGEMDLNSVGVAKRQSMGPAGGLGKGTAGDRSSWTLGGFA